MNQTTATTLTRTFADDATISLLLDNARGDVTIHADADAGTASVELRADREVDFEQVELSCRDGRVVVDVPALLNPEGSRGFSFSLGPLKLSAGDAATVDVIVHVPHGAQVEARTRVGDVSVTGVTGTTRITTGSGDLRAQECAELRASSGSGDISVGTLTAGTVTTGSGDVRVEECTGPGALQLRSGSGDLTVRTRTGETTAATGSGDIDLDLRAGGATLRTGTGDVVVRVPRETPVWLDLNTGLGDVTQRIDPVGPPQQGQDHLSVSVRSGTGDILITH
ncbi:DUF4097 family beta strand repeat-containing protein [Ornithinimicrobium pratense]|uniref:DUF4097 domain-containing protein n=1 Tax=Ornithinimicrobium pratense TaxID=2593973 RepID=A0A5J6V896_9MICO|nr:DUF4097 family beta strand repeat-containing protein [Ornithinimicrobium pratense]QFG69371.1 DUF4097 domain-containing protein [Ornithinimicrobium pratense]